MYLAADPSSASSLNEFACLESPPSLFGPLPTCLTIPHLPSLPLPPTQGPAAGVMGATRAPINVGEALERSRMPPLLCAAPF